jgi:sortase (surface protein transpeptidase)
VFLALAGGGCATAESSRRAAPLAEVATTPPDTRVPSYEPTPPVLDVAAPVRLEIPAIGVSAALARLGLNPDGTMQVPSDFATAGWYTFGPKPGEDGPAVIAGHIDSRRGPAVFYRLRELAPGDEVLVERVDGSRARFVVQALARFPKTSFPTDDVFAPTTQPELRLITCDGAFDSTRRSYVDNLIAFASLAEG